MRIKPSTPPALPPLRNPTTRNPFTNEPLFDAEYVRRYAIRYAELLQEQAKADTGPYFVLKTPDGDEGDMIFEVNGQEVFRCNHDTSGWQGMADQKTMFENIAHHLGAKVQHIDMGEQA